MKRLASLLLILALLLTVLVGCTGTTSSNPASEAENPPDR